MDLFISSLTFLILYFSLVRCVKAFIKPTNERLPPGPWKLPFIGSLHHFVSSILTEPIIFCFNISSNLLGILPHRVLGDLATKYGAIMHFQLGEISAVVVSSPEAAKEVLKPPHVLATRPALIAPKILSYGCLDIALSPPGDYWRKMRRICVSELSGPKSIQTLCAIREDEALSFVNSIKASVGSPINLSQKIVSYFFNVTSRAAFGNQNLETNVKMMNLINEATYLVGGFAVADLFPSLQFLQFVSGIKSKAMKVHQDLDNLFDSIIKEHRKNMEIIEKGNLGSKEVNENLLDAFLRLEQRGGMEVPDPMSSIKAVIWDMFVAGTETTSSVIELVIAEMINHPKVMERAQAELRKTNEPYFKRSNYLKMVIKETLRLHPPIPLLLRKNGTNVHIDGYNIPPKTTFIVNAWAINRDPKYWSDPEKFILERFNSSGDNFVGIDFEYIPFGGGRRVCPGMEFGLASVETCLAQLLYHFDWELPEGKEAGNLDMRESFGASVRLKNNLVLVATPHSS